MDTLFTPEAAAREPSLSAHPVLVARRAVTEETAMGPRYYPGDLIDEVERRGLVPDDRDERAEFMDRLWSQVHPTLTSDFRRRGKAPRTLAEARKRLGRRADSCLYVVTVRCR